MAPSPHDVRPSPTARCPSHRLAREWRSTDASRSPPAYTLSRSTPTISLTFRAIGTSVVRMILANVLRWGFLVPFERECAAQVLLGSTFYSRYRRFLRGVVNPTLVALTPPPS